MFIAFPEHVDFGGIGDGDTVSSRGDHGQR